MNLELEDRHIFFLCLVGFMSLTILVVSNNLTEIDKQIQSSIFEYSQGPLFEFMKYFTYIGDVAIVLPATGIIMYYFYRQKDKLVSFYYGSMVVSSIISSLAIKYLVERLRPNPGLSPPAFHPVYSYPSGHTVRVFVLLIGFYVFYSIFYKRQHNNLLLLSCIVVPIVVGISRIILGLHYLTDIIGSILLGGSIIIFFKILINRNYNRLTRVKQ